MESEPNNPVFFFAFSVFKKMFKNYLIFFNFVITYYLGRLRTREK